MREAAGEDEQELANEMAEAFLGEDLPENVFGAPKAGAGMWASVLRVLDPAKGETTQQVKETPQTCLISNKAPIFLYL